jgi:hypothetical protein
MKTPLKTLAVALALSGSLGGCAVYSPPPTYSEVRYYDRAPVYVEPAPTYVYPAPVIVQPAPFYAAPPVWFGLNFHYRGGGGHGWGGRRHYR